MTARLKLTLALGGACLSLLALAGPASAAMIAPNIFTDELNADGNCSLREAVQATNTNATVSGCVHDGNAAAQDTINLSANEFDLILNGVEDDNQTGDLDVQAGTGGLQIVGTAGMTSIDGNGATSGDRILHVESDAVAVQGVTLVDGLTASTPGGAIFTQTSSNAGITLTNSVVNTNVAGGAGGGLQVSGSGGATITNTLIDDNTSAGGGGISHSSAGPLTITNSTIADNTVNAAFPVVSGGGIAFNPPSDAALTITGSLIDNNTVTSTTDTRGGGVNVEGVGSMTVNITSSVISNNDAVATGLGTSRGGGLRFGAPVIDGSITDSVISGNTATVSDSSASNSGAGVLNLGNSRIVRSTVSGNTQSGGDKTGAGIRNEDSLVLLNDTISGNTTESTLSAGGAGNGLYQSAGTTTMVNTTVTNNTGAESGADAIENAAGSVTVRGSIIDLNCVGTITSANFNVSSGNTCQLDEPADEELQPLSLGPLQDNGGPDAGPTGSLQPVPTHLPAVTSTVVEQIPAASCTDDGGITLLATDERGLPRPFDGNDDSTADCDAGAVEVFQCDGAPATHVGTAAGETINGSAGGDNIVGLGGNDTINLGAGQDQACGNEGNDMLNGDAAVDALFGGTGDDTLNGGDTDSADFYNGGPGPDDEVTFANAVGPVGADLDSGNTTGVGGDGFVAGTVENLRGGTGDNLFVGDAGNNDLRGGAGDDDLRGLDGNDLLDGEGNAGFGDIARFGAAPGPGGITASLEMGTASGDGIGSDTLQGLENLDGSPFADNLTGSVVGNSIFGGAGNDMITGLGGMDVLRGEGNDDSLFARDGVQDDVDCGNGTMDSVQADQMGVDLIVNCESIDFFVPPVIPPAATPPATTPTTPAPPKKKKCKKKKKKGKKGAVAAKKCKKKKKKKR